MMMISKENLDTLTSKITALEATVARTLDLLHLEESKHKDTISAADREIKYLTKRLEEVQVEMPGAFANIYEDPNSEYSKGHKAGWYRGQLYILEQALGTIDPIWNTGMDPGAEQDNIDKVKEMRAAWTGIGHDVGFKEGREDGLKVGEAMCQDRIILAHDNGRREGRLVGFTEGKAVGRMDGIEEARKHYFSLIECRTAPINITVKHVERRVVNGFGGPL